MMSATEMNFGPDWLRALSDGAAKGSNSNSSSNSLTNSISSNSSQSRTKSTSNSSGHHPHHHHHSQSNHPVSKYRYSFEEMLLYYNRSQCTIPDDLAKHEEVYVDEVQDPVAFVPITAEEFNLLSQNINCDSILKKAAKEANGTVFGGSDILAAGGISEVRAKLINSAVDLPANRGERNAYNNSNNNTNNKSNNIIGGSPSSGGVGGGLPGGGGLFNERVGGGSQLRRGSSIGSSVERTGTGNVGLSNRPPGFRNSLFSRVSSYDESSSSSASGLVRSGSNSNHPSNNNQSAQNSTNSGSTAASLFSHSSKPKSILQRNYSSSIDSTTGSTSSAAAATAAMFVPTWRQNSTGSGSGQSTNSGTTGAGFAAAVAATLTTSTTAASATAESNKSNEWRSTSDTSKNWRVDGSSSGGPKILASSYKTPTGAASAAASKDFDIDDPSGPTGGNYWDNVQRKRNSKTATGGNKLYGRGGGVRSFDSDYNDLFKTFDAPLDMLDAERDLFGGSGGSSTATIPGTNSPAGNSRSFGGNLQPNYSELFSGTRGGKQPPGFTRFSRDRSNNANDYGKEYESGNTKPWNKSTSSWNSSDNRYSLSNRNHYHSGGGGYHNNNSQHQYGNPRSHNNNNNNYDGEHDEGQHDRRGSLPEWSLEDPSSIDVTRVGSFDASGAFHEAPFDEDGSIGGALEDDDNVDDEVDDKDKLTRDNSRKTSKDQKTMKSDNNKSSTAITTKTSLKNVENQKKKMMTTREEDSSRKDSLSDNQPRVSGAAAAAAAGQSSTRGEIVNDDHDEEEEGEAEKTAKQELKYELEKMLQQFSNNNNSSDTQQQQENTIMQKGGRRLDPTKTNPSHQMTNNSASSSVNTPKIDYFNFNDEDNESNDNKSYNQQQHNSNNSQQHSGGFGANDNHHQQQQQMIDKDNFLHNHHRQQQQQHDSFAQMVQQQQKQQQSSGGGQGSNDKFSSSMQNFSRENCDDNSNNNNSDILGSSGDNHQGLLSNQFGKLLIDSNSSDSQKQESLNLSQQQSSSIANNNKPNMRSEFLNERYLQQQQQLKAAANQAASQSQHVSSNNPQQQSQSSASLFEMLSNSNNNEQSQQDPIIGSGQASIKQSSSLLDDNFGLASSFGSQPQHPHQQQQSSMFSHLSKQCAEQPIAASAQVGPVAFGELSSTNSDLMNSNNSRLGLSNLMPSQQELKGPAPHLVKSQQQQLHNQLLIAEAQKWYYCDPQGNIQGPFNAGEMCDWFASGYFSMELLVRRGCDQVFSKLGQLYQVCGNRAPFLPITPAQQQYLLSQPETAALGALIFPPPILANPPAPSSPPLSANNNNNNPNFQPQQSQQPQHSNNFGPSNLDELNPQQQQVRPQSDSLILGQMMQQRQQPAPPINPTVTQPSSASDISNLPGIGHPQNNMQAQAQLRFILDHLMKQELFRQLTTAQQHQIVLEKFLQMNGTNTSNSGNSQQRAVPVSVSSEPQSSFQSQQKQPVFGPQPTGHVSANIGDHQQQQGFGPQSIAHVPTNIVEHQQQSHLDQELHHPQHHPHQNILDHHHPNLAHSRPNLHQQSPITTKNPLSFHQEQQQLHHPPHHQQPQQHPQENSPSPPAQSPAVTALGSQPISVVPKPSALQIIQSAMAAAAGQQQHLTTTEVLIPQQQQAPISIGNSQSVSQTLQSQPLPPVQGSVPWETIVPGALSLSAVEEMQRREAEERFIRLQQQQQQKQAAEIVTEPSETTTHKSSKEEQQQTQQRSNNKTPKSAAKQAKAAAKQQKTESKPEPQQVEQPKQLPTTRLHEPQHSPSPSQPSQQPLVIPEMPQLPKKSVWGNPTLAEVQPATAQPQSTQSIAEIQKLQEEKEREEEERKRQALQQQQQMASFIAGQQQNSASGIPFKWATQQWQTEQSPKIKTLAEIQAEEAAQLAILRKQQAEAEARRRQANNNAVGTPLSVIVAKGGAAAAGGNASGGVWNNSSSSQLFTNNTGTSSPKTTGSVGVGFWEDDDPPLSSGQISLTNFKNALNMSGKAKVDGPFLRQLLKSNPKNVKKLEESQLMKLGIETSDDLYRYSVDILSKSFEQIDAQSFISIIKDLGSPNEVIEYIQCFLGNNQSAMYFAKFFISKKSYLFNKSKQEAAGQTKQSQQSKSQQQHQQSNQRSGGIWDDDDDEQDHQNSADQEYDDYEGGGNDGNDYYDDYESYSTPAVSTSNRHVQQQRNQQSTGSSYKSALNQNLSAQQQKQQQSTHNNNKSSAVQSSSPAKSSNQQTKAKNTIINSSVHQSPKSTKNVEPQDSSALMTAAVESMRDFDNWCIEVLKQNFELDIDAETFVSFLKDIDSPFEINEYVSTYLGNCRASRDFGKNFIAKRSYLRNKAKQEQYEDMCGPAPAITPSVNSKLDSSVMNSAQSLGSGTAGDNTGFVTVSSSSKKKRKGPKKQAAD